ncbi:hypothetical protein NDU88_004761 [Pleurodeles waltl]|uniref:Uncharacterized protein n=1 Tax=Pleurodeles waltl TaxID=8319 RepID=A0AAV7TSF1_PLEWA|nr:hypothetical protein NDU88_004761 [Pleurodeles waltl]
MVTSPGLTPSVLAKGRGKSTLLTRPKAPREYTGVRWQLQCHLADICCHNNRSHLRSRNTLPGSYAKAGVEERSQCALKKQLLVPTQDKTRQLCPREALQQETVNPSRVPQEAKGIPAKAEKPKKAPPQQRKRSKPHVGYEDNMCCACHP